MAELLVLFEKKYKNLDVNLALKSLVYFDVIKEEPIIYKSSEKANLSKIKSFLLNEVKSLL